MADAAVLLNESSAAAAANASAPSRYDYDPCAFHSMPGKLLRFYLVAVAGSAIASVGIVNNVLMLYLFVRRLNCFHSHLFYLSCLCIADVSIEISFILMFPVSIVSELFELLPVWAAWHAYVRIVAAWAQISLTTATYLMVAASVERFLMATRWTDFSLSMRITSVALVLLFAVLTKASVFFELRVVHKEQCTGMASIGLEPSLLAFNPTYYKYWMFYFRNVAHVFAPFILLLTLNGLILHRARRELVIKGLMLQIAMNPAALAQKKANKRAATRMLVAIVSTYLITNMLNLSVTIWEHVDVRGLMSLYNGLFYQLAADTATLLTLTCGGLRLQIYYAVNKQIRLEVRKLLSAMCMRSPCAPIFYTNSKRQRCRCARKLFMVCCSCCAIGHDNTQTVTGAVGTLACDIDTQGRTAAAGGGPTTTAYNGHMIAADNCTTMTDQSAAAVAVADGRDAISNSVCVGAPAELQPLITHVGRADSQSQSPPPALRARRNRAKRHGLGGCVLVELNDMAHAETSGGGGGGGGGELHTAAGSAQPQHGAQCDDASDSAHSTPVLQSFFAVKVFHV